jgi:preprotein translocase subunit SecG
MANVLIVAYLLIVLALITVILLQRSEGGGLGMGGNAGGLLSVRGSANLLTRTTAILAALFFATAIGLTILTDLDSGTRSILESAADGVGEGAATPTTVLDALNQLQGDSGGDLPVPDSGLAAPGNAPATPATPAVEPDAEPSSDPALAVPSAADPAEDEPADGAPAAPAN